jgi:hypothetical protein
MMIGQNLGPAFTKRVRDLSRTQLLGAVEKWERSPGNGRELATLRAEVKRRKAADALLPESFRQWS